MNTRPIAICTSDWHLSLTAPSFRKEKDWLAVQAKYMHEVLKTTEQLNVPLLIAGDIFDRWNAPAELINFASNVFRHYPNLPILTIPGQHDLPYHNTQLIEKSAYWTLIRMKGFAFQWLRDPYPLDYDWTLYPVQWGETNPWNVNTEKNVMMTHRYIWDSSIERSNFADWTSEIRNFKLKEIKPFNMFIFGDNHQHFTSKDLKNTTIVNCGTLIKRKANEAGYTPAITIIYENGEIEKKYLKTDDDEYNFPNNDISIPDDFSNLLEALQAEIEHKLDFVEAVKLALERDELKPDTKRLLLEAIGHGE